jgi:hypothetical protein
MNWGWAKAPHPGGDPYESPAKVREVEALTNEVKRDWQSTLEPHPS